MIQTERTQTAATRTAGTKTAEDDALYRVLRGLHRAPDLSQRALAREAGISLGCVNYCLKALAVKGLSRSAIFRSRRTSSDTPMC